MSEYGIDDNQPGGWIYNILPFVEQQPLYDLGIGQSDKQTAARTLVHTLLSMANCPSRRPNVLHPSFGGTTFVAYNYGGIYNTPSDCFLAHADYAANAGSTSTNDVIGPTSVAAASSYAWHTYADFTGVIFQRSKIKMGEISDGSSRTFLVGEKYLNPDCYLTGLDLGDNENMYSGFDNDTLRWPNSSYPPRQDQPGTSNTISFGSAHSNGFHAAFCDGSVQMITYSIDPMVYEHLGNRKDGVVIDAKEY